MTIDRTSKFAVAQLVDQANHKKAREFLEHLLETVPQNIHAILTVNHCLAGDLAGPNLPRGSIWFSDQPSSRNTVYARLMRFDMICDLDEIEHRLTKPNHPWTDSQVERMNRATKDATVKMLSKLYFTARKV